MPDNPSPRDEDTAFLEGQKLLFEAFKEMTTLSAASTVLLGTFLSDLFKQPSWKPLVSVSFLGFTTSVGASLLVMVLLAVAVQRRGRPSSLQLFWGIASMIVSVGGYLMGLLALATFAVKNF